MITNEHMTEMRIKSKKSQDRNEQDFTEEVQGLQLYQIVSNVLDRIFVFLFQIILAHDLHFLYFRNRDWMSFHKDWYLNEETFHLQ